MKLIPRQKIWLCVAAAANLCVWIIASDVVELVARQKHVLLGRYSLEHFTINLVVLHISVVSLYIDWSTGETYKRRWFRVLASLLVCFPILLAADFVLRVGDERIHHYRRDGIVTHRPPNERFDERFDDKPEVCRSYPIVPPGYGATTCELRTDQRGFRNQTDLARYDIVVLGDSFAEGSRVSDEHSWPVRLANSTGRTVYNLGMSGNAPMHYRASLEKYGLSLDPRVVICMLYEGNDFRSAKSYKKEMSPSFSKRVKRYVKQSPVINAMEAACIYVFGPIRADSDVPGIEILSWLPVAIPEGGGAKHYAFAPKQLLGLLLPRDQFQINKRWFNARGHLTAMKAMCDRSGATLVVVYAPTTAHVVLPVVWDRLPAEKVRAFAALRSEDIPTDAGAFMSHLSKSIGGKEAVVAAWCEEQGVPMLSMTPALRKAVVAGRQVYFTYDQHWTPVGHEVVADTIAAWPGFTSAGDS